MSFKLNYFILAILLLIIEVLIALFAHDEIIRPYAGDLLVVILLYCCIKSFVNSSATKTVVLVLLFAYMIESMQYFNLLRHLGLNKLAIANIIMGNYFTWIDILAYTLGILLVLIVEKRRYLNVNNKTS